MPAQHVATQLYHVLTLHTPVSSVHLLLSLSQVIEGHARYLASHLGSSQNKIIDNSVMIVIIELKLICLYLNVDTDRMKISNAQFNERDEALHMVDSPFKIEPLRIDHW